MSKPRRYLLPVAVSGLALLPLASFVACGSSSPANGNGSSNDASTSPSIDSGGNTTPDTSTPPGGDAQPAEASVPDDGGASDAGFVQAAHLPFPQLVYSGAPLILAPKVVTITFKGDTFGPELETFGSGITSTTKWWPTVINEYCQADGGCIGNGPAGVSAAIDASAPASVTDPALGPTQGDAGGSVVITTYLEGLMANHEIPMPDGNTLYAVYFSNAVGFNGGGSGCDQGFEGYHSEGTYLGVNYNYSINLECLGTLTDVTVTSAHETAEAASDGFSTDTTGGYYINYYDPNTWGWSDDFDGEIADMCDDYFGLGQDHWTEGSFVYQRIWSVDEAAANRNPCKPVPAGEVYFNAAPATAFLEMNVGETITIEVDAFSDAPTADWSILAQDFTDPNGVQQYVAMEFSGGTTFDGGAAQPGVTGINNGSKPKLSITLIQDPSQAQNGVIGDGYGEADISLWSYAGSSDITKATAGHYWPMAVMTRAVAQDAGVTTLDGAVPQVRLPGSPPAVGVAHRVHRVPRWPGRSK